MKMRVHALKPTYFKRFFIGYRGVAAFLLGTMLVCGAAAKAVASGSEPVKKIDPLLEEDRVHKLSIFSYMQPLERRGRPVPILVTLNIKGPQGLRTFCEYRPKILEAVLTIITDDQVMAGDRKALVKDLNDHMLEAVNYALPGAPVSGIAARAGRSASEFGMDIVHTNKICKKLDG